MRQRAEGASSPGDRQRWTDQATTLREKYVETLQKFEPSLMEDGGIYVNERDVLADDDAFALISGDGRSCVIMTDGPFRQLVLGRPVAAGEGRAAWSDLRCVVRDAADRKFPRQPADPVQAQAQDRAQRGTGAVL
ncbi:hypothetical protein PQR05_38450, partial [Paraburkholderia sediminicola]|uniref:hypothetical protein n=1 Tax=Paraburkholderia sediminicola TaxID=458836 RepID=UPI0038BAE7F8